MAGFQEDSFGNTRSAEDFDYFNRDDINLNDEIKLSVLIPPGAIIDVWFLPDACFGVIKVGFPESKSVVVYVSFWVSFGLPGSIPSSQIFSLISRFPHHDSLITIPSSRFPHLIPDESSGNLFFNFFFRIFKNFIKNVQ